MLLFATFPTGVRWKYAIPARIPGTWPTGWRASSEFTTTTAALLDFSSAGSSARVG